MALCKRCGQHTEADAEFCDACGGYPGRAEYVTAGGYQASSAAAGDYRPEGSGYQDAGSPGRGGLPGTRYLAGSYTGLPPASTYRPADSTHPPAGSQDPATGADPPGTDTQRSAVP